jgi:hypothetical protein
MLYSGVSALISPQARGALSCLFVDIDCYHDLPHELLQRRGTCACTPGLRVRDYQNSRRAT